MKISYLSTLILAVTVCSIGCARLGDSNLRGPNVFKGMLADDEPEFMTPRSMVAIWKPSTFEKPGSPSIRGFGGVFGYAGTTPERAQETLDVTMQEIQGLTTDLQQHELDRWKVRIESGLIMEQESSASRASSLVSDFYQQGRAVTTTELESKIESLTLDDVRDYWTENPPSNYRLVTLGPDKLNTTIG